MAITKKLLKQKGFKLNTYPKGKFWEYETKDKKIIENILQEDSFGDENVVCLQLKEDYSDKKLAADSNVWEIETEKEFLDILERMYDKEDMLRCDFCRTRLPVRLLKRTHYGSGFGYVRIACQDCMERLGSEEIKGK